MKKAAAAGPATLTFRAHSLRNNPDILEAAVRFSKIYSRQSVLCLSSLNRFL